MILKDRGFFKASHLKQAQFVSMEDPISGKVGEYGIAKLTYYFFIRIPSDLILLQEAYSVYFFKMMQLKKG
ncbi:MAG: hypothetical protein KC455_00170 [Carnobacterium sp.]|nr:hypothetical protein [Carnobacterium sp.]